MKSTPDGSGSTGAAVAVEGASGSKLGFRQHQKEKIKDWGLVRTKRLKNTKYNSAKSIAVALDPTGILKLFSTFDYPKCSLDS